MASQSPLPTAELQEIAQTACEQAIGAAEAYDHAQVGDWNSKIIQYILQTLIKKTSTSEATPDTPSQPPYKYIANSTVIQHIGSPAEPEKHGRRGMHSAVGAFWNNEKDGTYSYKWEAAEKKGMDIVITITWIAI
ncbi:dynein light chain Tctex1 [Pyrenophora tritici-repentis]|uniref:Tctex-1 domain containing protein n=1 Tax=Pyrenophora tritici-repentis TaxID=45151 RepID=A0A2W1H5B8_9PLEO|nr:Tctex-1 domain-containing protein [Pyrenophora tritici-repentis]KAF7447691.1 Tctex-1 domain containing protein [Pyrenophora tritici-repentis]KAF7571381.1 Tctex-1 domain containing protein [Pyrenophora tritici-repentis]KAG9385380.1 Tctex-1 domain containing protein [Pyrenophora tritici-repentis]KAI0585357.1 Tctex-1 domain-containing protein [Pyrenophora tritici-repentis]